ncbi:Mediator of RNA polymerase II transcription subunit 17 [Labeo rohita]|uniref:Mediator of RNA polymerase II transcription subunit 17 n=1 Tax=Labeo rohita TaxID=84645 RepID=A0ABQ8M080_LABRO|nr:Mediator of RNA polymerase II transcription subunit 17 [Labeo rohita]
MPMAESQQCRFTAISHHKHVHGYTKVMALIHNETSLGFFLAQLVESCPVELPRDGAGSSRSGPSVPFGSLDEDKMSNAASEEGLSSSEAEDSTAQHPTMLESGAELTAMLLRATKSNGLEPRSTPVPFFPEVHEELAKTWKAPHRLFRFELFPLQYPRWWDSQGATSTLHAMAILQVHQTKTLKKLQQPVCTSGRYTYRVEPPFFPQLLHLHGLRAWLVLPSLTDHP